MRPSRPIRRILALGAVLATAACADDVGRSLAPGPACDWVCALSAALDPDAPKPKPPSPPAQRAAAVPTLQKKSATPRGTPDHGQRVASTIGARKPKWGPSFVTPAAVVLPATVGLPASVGLPAPVEARPPGAAIIPGSAPSVAPTFDGYGPPPQH